MSRNLSRAVEPFVTSVVVGKDVVPRMSVVNIGRLIDQMVGFPAGLGLQLSGPKKAKRAYASRY